MSNCLYLTTRLLYFTAYWFNLLILSELFNKLHTNKFPANLSEGVRLMVLRENEFSDKKTYRFVANESGKKVHRKMAATSDSHQVFLMIIMLFVFQHFYFFAQQLNFFLLFLNGFYKNRNHTNVVQRFVFNHRIGFGGTGMHAFFYQ